MSVEWSLPKLPESLHNDIEAKLQIARDSLGHATEKGDGSEAVWLEMLNCYLPKRYSAMKAHVVDSSGKFSDQLDVVICDRQYSPLIFTFKDTHVVPAESVYAVFKSKQTVDSRLIS